MEDNGNVKVNVALLVKERKRQVWSQQHLADVAGISLRTIQRIEKTAVASADSLKALSSAFEKDPNYFLPVEETVKDKVNLRFLLLSLTAIVLTIIITSYHYLSEPDKIHLKVVYKEQLLETDKININDWLVELALASELSITLPNDHRLILLPYKLDNGRVLIDITFKSQSSQLEGVKDNSSPLTYALDQGISIPYESESGKSAVINITKLTYSG